MVFVARLGKLKEEKNNNMSSLRKKKEKGTDEEREEVKIGGYDERKRKREKEV